MTTILHQFRSQADGITAFVTSGANGFHVSLRDDDCGEFVGATNIYPELDWAVSEARKIVGA